MSVQPQNKNIIFYDIDNLKNNNIIIENIQSIFGRYAVKNVNKYNCIFIAGIQGIYLISIDTYKLISFFKIDECISSIDYDFFSNRLICGSWKKNYVNTLKNK